VRNLLLIVALCLFGCSSIEQFPYEACLYDKAGRFDEGTVIDRRSDGDRLFKFKDSSLGDRGYRWVGENDIRVIRRCKAGVNDLFTRGEEE
jgi:hypothetical protein